MGTPPFSISGGNLDPADWPSARAQGHRMLDDILDYIENIRERPVWQPIPDSVRARFHEAVPSGPTDLAAVHDEFMRHILPYATGNTHPGFHGLGARRRQRARHAGGDARRRPERQSRRPRSHADRSRAADCALASPAIRLSGQRKRAVRDRHVDGESARRADRAHARLGCRRAPQGRRHRPIKRLVAYTSAAAHGCIAQAMDLSGLGTEALHVIPTNGFDQIDIDALNLAIAAGPHRRTDAVPRGRHRRHRRHRRNRRPRDAGFDRAARENLVPRRWRHWRARDHGAGHRAAARRHPGGRLDRARFPQMGPGALRRRLHPGARRHDASRHVCLAGCLSAARDARARGRRAMALRLRSRSVARLSSAEDLVHPEGLWHRCAWAR